MKRSPAYQELLPPSDSMQGEGWALILVWPHTLCKQTSAWYDPIAVFLGLSRKSYYRVGHAAIVVIDRVGRCHYADFGRYHAPVGTGRVRTATTDHDLSIPVLARQADAAALPENLPAILHFLANNPSCHGDGPLHVSAIRVDRSRIWRYIQRMQMAGFHRYGPFVRPGTNCSRFVLSSAIQGCVSRLEWAGLVAQGLVTPIPRFMVLSGSNCGVHYPDGELGVGEAGRIFAIQRTNQQL